MTEIQGNEPTGYSYPAAQELRSAAKSLAQAVAAKESSRAKYARGAEKDFRGFFAEAFKHNVSIGTKSANSLSEALREVASEWIGCGYRTRPPRARSSRLPEASWRSSLGSENTRSSSAVTTALTSE